MTAMEPSRRAVRRTRLRRGVAGDRSGRRPTRATANSRDVPQPARTRPMTRHDGDGFDRPAHDLVDDAAQRREERDDRR